MTATASPPHRVVISGMGFVTPLGATPHDIVASLRRGDTPFAPSPVLPGAMCCPVNHFDDKAATGGWRHRRYLNRGALFALASALGAARDSGYTTDTGAPCFPEDTCLVTAAGPNLDIGRDFPAAYGAQPHTAPDHGELAPTGLAPTGLDHAWLGHAGLDHDELDALWLLRWLPNTAASAIANRLNLHGEGLVVGNACAAALHALGEGFRRVRHGLASCVVVAAGDSRLSEGGMLGYGRADALYRTTKAQPCTGEPPLGHGSNHPPHTPHEAMRPFDTARQGFVPGEGGAAFVLETEASALARGILPWAVLHGFGATLDGGSLTAPDPTATHACRAVRNALAEAGHAPHHMRWVAAHGTSTPLNDMAEATLLHTIFGHHTPAITALKAWTGHTAAACGAVELALLLACARSNLLPHIRNLAQPCAQGLDLVRTPRPFPAGPGIIQSFGFGGQNAALVVEPWLA